MSMPTTTDRVTRNTAQQWNERIERQMERNIAYYAAHPEEIDKRMLELDREWDIERTLEAQSAGITIISLAMAALFSRRWLYVPVAVGGFMFQHATQGWCPPLPILRRFGVRTQTEIECERYALKALRGDFSRVPTIDSVRAEADEDASGTKRVSRRILEIVKG